MVKALERKINLSPRKLVVKQKLQESGKIAAARYTPKTPHREKRGGRVDVENLDVQTDQFGTPLARNKRKSASVRTLEDYFNKSS